MSISYVCLTYDAYDPNTGLFNIIRDCIEWNTETQGPLPSGTTPYATLAECYDQSICIQSGHSTPQQSPNLCEITIKEITLIEKNNNQIIVNISLPQQYYNTHIEYALYDIDDNLIQDFRPIKNTSNPLSANSNYSIDIDTTTGTSGGGGGGSGGGCPSKVRLSGWEAVHKINYEPGVSPSQWVNPPDFIYKNINGTYTNLGIDAQGFSWYRSDNYGRWDLDPDGNNTWIYTANTDSDSGPMTSAVDRWYISMTNEPFPITLQLAWGISFGELSDTYNSTRLLAFGTPEESCPTNINISNLTLDPLPTNIDDPTKRWSGITKVGDIISEDGSGSGSESGSGSGFDICRLAFRLVKKCSGSGSG